MMDVSLKECGRTVFPPGGACGEAACVQQSEQTRALAFASFGSPLIASVGRGFVLRMPIVPITSGADAVIAHSPGVAARRARLWRSVQAVHRARARAR